MLVANVGVKINWRQVVSPTTKTVRFSNPKKRHQHELCVTNIAFWLTNLSLKSTKYQQDLHG